VDVTRNHNHPEIAQAAFTVLEACGFDVIVPQEHDFGRPAFSKGNLTLARQKAIKALNILAPFAAKNIPIVGLEPSDISMLTEDNASLLSNDERVKQVAAQTFSFEEFMWREMQAGNLAGKFKAPKRENPATRTLSPKSVDWHALQRRTAGIPRLRSAGSRLRLLRHGWLLRYEAEHYDLSMQIGELTLFPRPRPKRIHADCGGWSQLSRTD